MFNAGKRGKRAPDGTGFLTTAEHFNQQNYLIPTVTSFQVTDVSYVPTDDLAVDTAGGQTIVVNGFGFAPGASVQVGATTISVVTFVDSNRLSFTAPALSSGSYTIYVTNANGGTGILVPGLVYSGLPTFTTSNATPLANLYETSPVNTLVSASGDAPITYSISSGALPAGVTLNSDGTITGTSPVDGSSTTYNFTIKASDAQLQDSTRSFSLTINTDVVTFDSPSANGTVYTAYEYVPFSNIVMRASSAAGYSANNFSANTLPTGLTISGNTISGTVNTVGNTNTRITATASTTNRTAVRDVVFNVSPDIVTWNTPVENYTISTYEYTPISNVTANATSIAGFGLLYSANATPTGISLNVSSGLISGTPTTTGNTYAVLTATANTTSRTNTRNIVYNVNQDVVTWSDPTADAVYSLTGGSAISNVSLSATSAAGKTITYSANSLPTGLSISGSTIYGTPTTAETVYTALTATADTTNRSAVRYISWSVSIGDTFFKHNTLFLSADSTIQTQSFVSDNSLNNSQIIVLGDTRAQNFNPNQHGYYSQYFDGVGDYNTVTSNTAFAFGTGDFTVECWLNVQGAGDNRYCFPVQSRDGTNVGFYLQYDRTNQNLTFASDSGTPFTLSTAAGVIQDNVWYHFSASRSGTTVSLYLNGTFITSTTSSENLTSTGPLYISRRYVTDGALHYFNGYISNLRIVKGSAIVPPSGGPTTPLTAVANTQLLICHSNNLVDSSPNNFTVTKNGDVAIKSTHPFTTVYQAGTPYYSTTFNGSTDYIEVPNNATNQLSGSSYTMEMWLYPTISGVERRVFNKNGPSTFGWLLYLSSTDVVCFRTDSTNMISGTKTAPINTWTHVAVTNDGTTTRIFVNGQLSTSATGVSITSANEQGNVRIGARLYNNGNPFTGLISNARLIKGSALYTGAFTPSTTPLTTTSQGATASQVSFLTCQDSTLKDNSLNAYTITAGTTTVKPVASSPFTPSSYTNTQITTFGSGYFDGTGDYLTVPYSPSFSTGSTFTIEAWVYPTVLTTTNNEIFNITNTTTTNFGGLMFYVNGSGVAYFESRAGNGGTNYAISGGSVPLNTWTHMAVSVNNNSAKLFVNGVQVGSTTTIAALDGTQSFVAIGAFTNGFTAYPWTGYISDLRVVKGTALYTSNFAPQFTSPLTAVANTQLLTLQTNGNHNNKTFKDVSGSNILITKPATANTTSGTFSPYGDNWSILFNGSNSYINLPVANLGGFASNYTTIECWVYQKTTSTASGYNDLLGTWAAVAANGRFQIGLGSAASAGAPSKLEFQWTTSTGTVDSLATTAAIPVNTWVHLAIVVNATGSGGSHTVDVYINGTRESFTGRNFSSQTSTYDRLNFGGFTSGYFDGFISNFRFTRATTNTVGYSGSTINVPTAALSPVSGTKLLINSNKIVDSSQLQNTITPTADLPVHRFSPFGTVTVPKYYSTWFNGSTDYLTVPGSSNFVFAGDYTIEAWINSTSTTWSVYSTGGSGATDQFSCDTGTLYWAYDIFGGGISNFFTSTDVNQWTHVAVSRNSGTTKVFKNGILMATSSTNNSIGSTNAPNIGRRLDGVYYLNGCLSNLRIVKGTAIYTTASTTVGAQIFTPPTSTLTAVANTLLLTCQSNTFVDNSLNNFAITAATATVKPIPVSPFTVTANSAANYSTTTFGGSMYFDGSGDYLTAPYNTAYDLYNGNFTIEFWMYKTTTGDQYIVHNRPTSAGTGWAVQTYSNTIRFYFTSGISVNTTDTIPLNQWYHVALVNTGGTMKIYFNGVQKLSSSVGTGNSPANTTSLIVGCDNGPTYAGFFSGYISDLKITKGATLYTSNFYPGPTPIIPTNINTNANTYSSSICLTGTSGGVIDASRTIDLETLGDVKVTNFSPYNAGYYSNYFDGTGDYLSVANNAAFDFGSGDFTIECWFMLTGNASTTTDGDRPASLLGVFPPNGGSLFTDYAFGVTGSTTVTGTGLSFGSRYNGSGTLQQANYVGTITQGVWHHTAVTKTGNTVSVYYDGNRVVQNTSFTNQVNTNGYAFNIGMLSTFAASGYTQYFPGYISNMRVVKGSVLYSGTTYTMPTAPLTAVANTVLLTAQSSSFVDKSTNNFTVTRNGDAAVKPQNPFQVNSGQSYYFDGTGDYIYTPSSQQLQFGTGDYTIEYWVYPTSFAAIAVHMDFRTTNGASGGGLQIFTTTGGVVTVYGGSTTATLLATGPAIRLNEWTNIQLTRSGTSTKLFVNGNQAGTTATDSTSYGLGTMWLGVIASGGSNPFTGYMTDLRISKGKARYTANNTVSTSTLSIR